MSDTTYRGSVGGFAELHPSKVKYGGVKGVIGLGTFANYPDSGNDFLAGEFPDGRTTVEGVPQAATVRALWRGPEGHHMDGAVVATTQSAPDGTWRITGLSHKYRYDVVGRLSGHNDVIVPNVQPSRTDVVTLSGAFTDNEDFNGVAGSMTIESGMPPFTCEVIQPLPYGLSARVDGRKLLIEGVSSDNGLWESVVRVTASNGVWVDVPVQVEIQAPFDPHWDKVVALLHFGGDLVDETGRVWTGNGAFSYVGGRFGFGFTSGGGWVSTPTSTDLNLSTGDFTIECFMDLTGTSGLRALLSSGVAHWVAGNIYILVDGTNRLEIGSHEAGHIWISSATLPNSGTFHFCLERLAGELRLFVEGVLVDSKLSGVALNFSTSGTRIGVNSVNQNPFSGVIDELRIAKGVARYTENFTPPDKPFPSR